jgi:hypothetical protein
MWVFTYKFNEDGLLYKFKAWIIVTGDLQEDSGDTYAATLAARVFRFLMAPAAAFGLKAYQYDVLMYGVRLKIAGRQWSNKFNSMKSYLSRRTGCLCRQTAGSWNILDTMADVIIGQQPEDSITL